MRGPLRAAILAVAMPSSRPPEAMLASGFVGVHHVHEGSALQYCARAVYADLQRLPRFGGARETIERGGLVGRLGRPPDRRRVDYVRDVRCWQLKARQRLGLGAIAAADGGHSA
eukprot:CAMPEP_0174741124 /NCGR_PEP_ID=MMETSP1094-20130205/75419_1 /TAXON_ID=156173 /ORGANISM="Chrysochromulina brevifilum, Strain UTEX LB 985" /LENGTH=113 /DNA_ID=CAMNT_0015944945 /DNA_START=132 /DNA_END=470 /DNA_ORIENTATION=+